MRESKLLIIESERSAPTRRLFGIAVVGALTIWMVSELAKQGVPESALPQIFYFGIPAVFTFAVIASFNWIRYRVEVDDYGARLVGMIWTRDIRWDEVTDIALLRYWRSPGHYVVIRVDGTNNARRSWEGLFLRNGYAIASGMEISAEDIADILRRRWRQWKDGTDVP